MHRAQYRLHNPAERRRDPLWKTATTIGRVSEDDFRPREASQRLCNEVSAFLILPMCRMHDNRAKQTERVHGDVPLAARDLLAGIVAPIVAPFGRANRLTVDDGNARRRLLAGGFANPLRSHRPA